MTDMDKDKLCKQLAQLDVPNHIITDVYAALVAGDEAREENEKLQQIADAFKAAAMRLGKENNILHTEIDKVIVQSAEFAGELETAREDYARLMEVYKSSHEAHSITAKNLVDALADLETAVAHLRAIVDEYDGGGIGEAMIKAERWLMSKGDEA